MQLELTHFKAECRFVTTLMAVLLLCDMLDPALLILHVPQSVVNVVASLPPNRAPFIAATFISLSLLVVPYVLMQALQPNFRHRRTVVKMALFAFAAGSILWLFMAYLSRNLDGLGTVTGIFFRNFALQIAFSGVLAASLNNQQIRADHRQMRAARHEA